MNYLKRNRLIIKCLQKCNREHWLGMGLGMKLHELPANTNTHPSPCSLSRFSTLPGPGPASSKGSFSIHLLRSLSRSPAEPMVSHRHYRPIAPFPTGPEGQGFYRVRKDQISGQRQGSPQPSLRPRSARYVTRYPERVRSVPPPCTQVDAS